MRGFLVGGEGVMIVDKEDTIMTTTESLILAAFSATEGRREAALRVLRGEVAESAAKPVTGPLLLGMGVASTLLGVSRATLWRACQAGRLQKVELFPGSFRIRREDLIALAAGEYGFSGKKSRRGRPRKVRGPVVSGVAAPGNVGGGHGEAASCDCGEGDRDHDDD
jgi:hypothetical protein